MLPELREWDYGGYEGLSTPQIREELGRDWEIFRDGVVPGKTPGETVEDVAARASHVLAAPHDDLPAPIVLTGWRRQLLLTSADDPRFDAFLDAFVQGPTTPDLGAACHFGTGEPAVAFRAPR